MTFRAGPALATFALALLPAAQARGQPASGPRGRAVEWVVTLKGREIGREQAVTSEADGTRRVASRAELTLTATPFRYEQTLVLEGDTGAVTSYTLTSNVLRAEVRRGEGGLTVAVEIAGQRAARPVAGAEPVVVLDNLVFAHYGQVGRLAAARGGFAFTALVPQSAAALPARFEPGDAATGRLAGAERAVRAGRVTLGSVLVHLWYDPASGEVFAVEVPAQGLAARRAEFEAPAPARAQAPQAGRELTVEVPAPEESGLAPLGASLVLPAAGEGPWPTVLLLAGSGPQDRDETIGPNKPLRDLAHLLAARGVASLRVDKRSHQLVAAVRSGGEAAAAARELLERLTLREEYVDDAVAALRWLAARAEVGPLFVAGHSLGGLAAAPIVRAPGAPPVAGVVLIAAAGRGLDVLMREQMVYQAGLRGMEREAAAEAVERQLAPLARIRAGEDPGVGMVFGASVAYWRDVLSRDPLAEARSLPGPVLLLQGAEDCQVRVTDHDLLREALAARDGATHRAHVLPGLNHLLMKVDGPSTGAEYALPGHVAPEVADLLAEWAAAVSAPR